MRGPILREQFLDGATGECAGWDKGNQKKGGITMQSEKPPRSSYEPLRLRLTK